MTVADAMQTTFKGDGPTTHVTIARDMAEADHGAAFASDAEFAAWIDANNNRLYDAAVVKRETDTLYESVTLAMGDLPRIPAAGAGGVAAAIEPEDGEEEARVVAIGEPVEAADPLFVGTLDAALDHVLVRDLAYRSSVVVWTPKRIYGEDEFERLRDARARA